VRNLTDEQHRFVEDMGHNMVGWGLPRNTGRIWAYLLLRGEPAGLDEISAGIEVGKSSVSVGTRQLVQFGLARPIGERGSRRLLYEALYSLDTIFAARQAQLVDFLAKLRQGARSLPNGDGRERMEEMAETVQEFVDEVPEVFRQLRERRRA
jgi:DNA-binding transcriptional regulator GbsR (MarR family)